MIEFGFGFRINQDGIEFSLCHYLFFLSFLLFSTSPA